MIQQLGTSVMELVDLDSKVSGQWSLVILMLLCFDQARLVF
jgi:hypothetical protein